MTTTTKMTAIESLAEQIKEVEDWLLKPLSDENRAHAKHVLSKNKKILADMKKAAGVK